MEKGIIPVVAGFLGKTKDGKITTLGRGGSDTTAFILAEALNADEIVLVTDADGILSGDPKIVSNPERLKKIDVNTLVGLADSGAKFIHSKALKYKPKNINVRVINHAHGNLSKEGTVITGALVSELDAEIAHPFPVAEITVVGNGISANPQIIQEMVEKQRHSLLLGMSMNTNSIILLYASQEKKLRGTLQRYPRYHKKQQRNYCNGGQKRPRLHKNKWCRLRRDPRHNWKNSEDLRLNGIEHFRHTNHNISILLFVNWDEREKALRLIKTSLRSPK